MLTVIVAILVGAACLGIGYLLGKKKKVEKQINDALNELKALIEEWKGKVGI
jgi:hypothetical protein